MLYIYIERERVGERERERERANQAIVYVSLVKDHATHFLWSYVCSSSF